MNCWLPQQPWLTALDGEESNPSSRGGREGGAGRLPADVVENSRPRRGPAGFMDRGTA